MKDDNPGLAWLPDLREEQIEREIFRAASFEAHAEAGWPVASPSHRLCEVGLVVFVLLDAFGSMGGEVAKYGFGR